MSVKYTRSLSGKIIVALLAACLTLFVSWVVMNRSFQHIRQPVKRMSEPNPQLRIVNRLLKDVIYLDQLQRLQASSGNLKDYKPFLEQSARIRASLDSLYILSGANEVRRRRIDTMRSLLVQRDKVFFRYINLRQGFLENDSLSDKLHLLSEYINKSALKTDSNLFTSESSISATTIEDSNNGEEEKKGFWEKLFKRRKAPERKEVRHMILEQLKISVDTSLLLHEDSMISQLSQSISAVENERQQSRNTLLRQRVKLDHAGQDIIGQLLVMLNEMEHNELYAIEQNNLLATRIIDRGFNRISMILIAFIVLIIVLSVLIFTDISKSNRYRKELILARDEAEKLGQIRGKFMANMSHELRTPLQAIIGFTEQMAKDERQRTQKNSDIIFQAAQHLLHVVNEVLDYSRINSGKLIIESRMFPVKDITDSVSETIRMQARQKQLAFTYTSEADETLFYGDPHRLRQILFNLLGNAVKFTEKGAVSLQVTKKEYKRHTTFTFRIADTGIGIPPENHEKIFAHFEQLETDYLQHGTGLGLTIVKNLVEQQGGSIRLESEVGTGSVFSVSLAYTKAKAGRQDDAPLQQQAAFAGLVWIVDDDRTILKLCSMVLQQYGIPHQCFQAAEEVLHTDIPASLSVVLTDIRMPRTDGFELKDRLKQRTGNTVKYVALTAQSMPEEKAKILASGFDAMLLKPFLEKELTDLLFSLCPAQNPDYSRTADGAGDEEIWAILVPETADDLTGLLQAAQQQDLPAMADRLHRLAGRLGQLGIKDISREARRLEISLRRGEYDPQALNDFAEHLSAWLAARAQDHKL